MEIWSKEFAGRPECLIDARHFTLAVLGDCEAAYIVVLIADELAGNAIKHTASGEPGGEFVLRLARFGDRCRVRVDDQGGPSIPALYVAGDQDEAGRGLTIVNTLSLRWGFDGDENARSVWADVAFGATPAIPHPGGVAAGSPFQVSARRKAGMTMDDGKR